MNLEFHRQPSKPWLKILWNARSKIVVEQTLPELTGCWKNVPIQQVEAYQEICGMENSEFLPLPYLQVLATPLHIHLLAHSPLSVLGLVHTGQTLQAYRPIAKTEKIDLQVRIDDLQQVKKGGEFCIYTDAFVGDEKVWSATAKTFTRSLLGHGRNTSKEVPNEPQDSTIEEWSLAENLGRRYGKISGDFNPIHVHAWLAKPFGYKRAIIHGMWSLARSLSMFPEPVTSIEAAFVRPIFLPSKVAVYYRQGQVVLRHPKTEKVHMWVKHKE